MSKTPSRVRLLDVEISHRVVAYSLILVVSISLFFPLVQGMAERWMAYFGILFMLAIILFPKGVAGTIREKYSQRKPDARK